MNIVDHFAAKEPDIMLQELVEAKTEQKQENIGPTICLSGGHKYNSE